MLREGGELGKGSKGEDILFQLGNWEMRKI